MEPLGEIPINSHFVTLRSDLNIPLGVVGKEYKIIQNTDAFAFFDASVADGKDIKYETAGALGNGERIFITAKLAEGITVGNDDRIDQSIFLSTSHNGTGSIGTLFGAYNAVTGYFQNVRNFRTEEEKMKSILFGGTAQTEGQKAFDLRQEVSSDGIEILGYR